MARKRRVAPQNVERHIKGKERALQALELRRAGITYDQIADTLGYSSGKAVQQAVNRALDDALQEPAEEILQIEIARLDAILTTLWPKMRQGDLQATDRILRVMDRRARYLGLDAPEKIELAASIDQTSHHEHHVVVVIEGDDADYMKALEEAVQLHNAGGPKELPDPNTADIPEAEVVEDDDLIAVSPIDDE